MLLMENKIEFLPVRTVLLLSAAQCAGTKFDFLQPQLSRYFFAQSDFGSFRPVCIRCDAIRSGLSQKQGCGAASSEARCVFAIPASID
jgi:hypothetical protein